MLAHLLCLFSSGLRFLTVCCRLRHEILFFFPLFSMCSSYDHNKWISRQLVRVGFGLSLLFVGIAHYRDAENFALSVGNGLGYEWLVSMGTMWGYVLPFLFIVGGLSFTLNLFTKVGIWATGLSIASIPAGLMLKSVVSGMSLGDTMPPAMNAFIWLIIFMYAVKGTRKSCCDDFDWCGDCCDGDGNCECDFCGNCDMCGNDPCACEAVKPVKAAAPKKASKAAAKKPAAKKTTHKKASVKKASVTKA